MKVGKEKADQINAGTEVAYSSLDLIKMTHAKAAKVLPEEVKRFRLLLLFDAGRLNFRHNPKEAL